MCVCFCFLLFFCACTGGLVELEFFLMFRGLAVLQQILLLLHVLLAQEALYVLLVRDQIRPTPAGDGVDRPVLRVHGDRHRHLIYSIARSFLLGTYVTITLFLQPPV